MTLLLEERIMSQRIELLSGLARPNHVLFDLCCDHGLIGLHALKKAKRVVFVDQSENALMSLESTLSALDPASQAKAEVVAKPAEFIDITAYGPSDFIIAGVGVTTIVSILSALFPSGLGEHQLILSPQQDSLPLRWYLREKNYRLLRELAVEERGRFREILHIASEGQEVEENFQSEDDESSRAYKAWLNDYRAKIAKSRGVTSS